MPTAEIINDPDNDYTLRMELFEGEGARAVNVASIEWKDGTLVFAVHGPVEFSVEWLSALLNAAPTELPPPSSR